MAMRRIFWGFCRNWSHESLTLPFEPVRFLLRIRRDIRIRKTTRPLSTIRGVADSAYQWYGESPTPRITETRSRWLPTSLICGVADSPHHWYAESATPRITDTENRLLNFLKENFLYRWYRETLTPRTSDAVSLRLPVSLSWGVSAHHWYGESPTSRIVESESPWLRISVIRGVAIWKKN